MNTESKINVDGKTKAFFEREDQISKEHELILKAQEMQNKKEQDGLFVHVKPGLQIFVHNDENPKDKIDTFLKKLEERKLID